MRGLAPELSPEARQAVEDELTEAALTRVQQRAGRIATVLGTKVDMMRDVRVGNASAPPAPIRAMAAMTNFSQPAPPPVAEPGEATVSVTVDADIALAPRP